MRTAGLGLLHRKGLCILNSDSLIKVRTMYFLCAYALYLICILLAIGSLISLIELQNTIIFELFSFLDLFIQCQKKTRFFFGQVGDSISTNMIVMVYSLF